MAFSDFDPPSIWYVDEQDLLDSGGGDGVEDFIWTEARKLSWAKKFRQGMLIQTDWTVLPDSPLSEEKKLAFIAYRQGMRELFDSGVPVDEIVLPERPTLD